MELIILTPFLLLLNWHLSGYLFLWLLLDIKNAFLHGDLQEEVYMEQSPGFVAWGGVWESLSSSQIFVWFGKFSQAVEKFGMTKNKSDHFIFYKQSEADIILLVVYVDDIVIIGSDITGISSLKFFLHT